MTCVSGGALKAARAAGIVIDPAPRARATISRPARMYLTRPFDLIVCLLNPSDNFGATASGCCAEAREALSPPQRSSKIRRVQDRDMLFDKGRGFPFMRQEN